MADERAWLPTHLQAAERVLDKAPAKEKAAPVRKPRAGVTQRVRDRVIPGKSKGLPEKPYNTMRSVDEKVVRSMEIGNKYRLRVHNALSGQVSVVTGTYKRLDDNGILWFLEDGTAATRYFRPGALVKVKEVK